ncbi:MAG: hypothetical protein ACJAXS_003274 [Colwellia sp.]
MSEASTSLTCKIASNRCSFALGDVDALLLSGSVLCTDGNLSYKGIAKELDIDHKRLIGLDN